MGNTKKDGQFSHHSPYTSHTNWEIDKHQATFFFEQKCQHLSSHEQQFMQRPKSSMALYPFKS